VPVDSKPRIAGWLLVPLAWLIIALLASALVMTMYIGALAGPAIRNISWHSPEPALLQWGASLLTSAIMLVYTAWITWLFCQRSRRLPRHYLIWLLLNVVLALKAFVFSPVADQLAMRNLLFALLAASVLVPYFKRSQRVKNTFVAP